MQTINLRQLVTNYSFLSGAEVLSKILSFAAFSLLARILMPVNFGYLEFTLAVMLFLTTLVDFGTGSFGARELAKQTRARGELVANISALRLLLAFFGYLLLIGFVFLTPKLDFRLQRLLLIYGFTLFGIPFFLQWIFQGLDQMRWVAFGSLIRQTIFAIGVFLLIRRSDQLWTVGWIECAAVGCFILYQVVLVLSRIKPLHLQFNGNLMKTFSRESAPIGLSELTWNTTWYLPTFLLGLTLGGSYVGWFGAALRPIMTLHTFIWLYFYNLFPSLSRHAHQSEESNHELLKNSLRFSAWVAIFIALSGAILARPLIVLVFGTNYLPAVPCLRILVWMLSLALLSGHYRYLLIASNLQRYEFLCSLSALIVSLVLSLLLIPRFSTEGAAVAIVVAAGVNCALAYQFVHQKIASVPLWTPLAKPVLAGALMIGIYFGIRPSNEWLAAAAALIGFVTAFGMVGRFS